MRFRFRAVFLAVGLVSLWAVQAQAATIILTWQYTQNPQRPATSFAVQRCLPDPPPATTCAMVDLVGATAIPVTQLTYVDASIIVNQRYCYQVAAADAAGRSAYTTPIVCNGLFHLNVPTALGATVAP